MGPAPTAHQRLTEGIQFGRQLTLISAHPGHHAGGDRSDLAAQTIAQSMAGITLNTGEFIGKAGSFMLLSLFAIGLLVRFFRSIAE